MGFQSGASLILGGARSGKSAFAEKLADQSQRQKIYLATSEIWDKEMEDRVAQHKARRGDDWKLVEEPIDIAACLRDLATSNSCVLVDCLTLWLTNLMMQDLSVSEQSKMLLESLEALEPECSVLFVSNEVGQGIVPMDKMAREFRDHAGRLHQEIASTVPHVWFVTAGLPQKLK